MNLRRTIVQGSRRPFMGLGNPRPDGEPPQARWLLVTGVLLGAVMVAGFVSIYRTGAWSPSTAAASPTRPGARELTAGLDAARIYSRRGEWSKAEAVLRELSAKFVMEQEVRVALAESLVAQRRTPEAYEQYEKALAIGPRDAKLEYAAGVAANTIGKAERALEHFSMAQAADPVNASYPLALGMVQRKLGQVNPASASLLRAANLDPENAFAWGLLADIALAQNNVPVSLQHIARARKVQPESVEWRVIEARALKRKGDPEKALMVLLPIELSQRREAAVARLIGECYGMLGAFSEAAEAVADASTSAPTDGALAYDAAVALDRAGEGARALEFAKRAQMLGNADAAKLLARLKG